MGWLIRVVVLRHSLLLAGLFLFAVPAVTQTQKSGSDEGVVLFAVWPAGGGPQKNKGPDVPFVDPIAVLDAGEFRGLSGFDNKDKKAFDAAFDDFEKQFYAHGSRYPLFVHGAGAGTASVVEPVGISCVSTTATATLSRPLQPGEVGLAVSLPAALNVHSDRDAVVTHDERATFRDAAIAYLTHKGLSSSVVSGTVIDEVHAVFLSTRWPHALVGSALLRRKNAAYAVFLVLTESGRKPIPVIASYHRWADSEDGTDSEYEVFLGHLDVDGDSADEIFTISYYYESWAYTIYKFQNGEWRTVYKGSGGGC